MTPHLSDTAIARLAGVIARWRLSADCGNGAPPLPYPPEGGGRGTHANHYTLPEDPAPLAFLEYGFGTFFWDEMMSVAKCPACEGPMPQPAGRGRPRKWCSDSCRREAWRWRQSEDAMRGWLKFWAVLPPSDDRDAERALTEAPPRHLLETRHRFAELLAELLAELGGPLPILLARA